MKIAYHCEHCMKRFYNQKECLEHEKNCEIAIIKSKEIAEELQKILNDAGKHNLRVWLGKTEVKTASSLYKTTEDGDLVITKEDL